MSDGPSFQPSPTRVRYRIVGFLVAIAILGHFNRLSLAVAGSERIIPGGILDEQQLGWVYTIFLFVYTLSMMPAGWWIDSLGPKRALGWMGVGMGGSVVLTGMLGSLGLKGMPFFLGLVAVRSLAGLASAPLHPSAARMVSLWIPTAQRSWANGLVTAGALLGIAATYHVFGRLMDAVDWPIAFMICGALQIALALLWYVMAADHATEHPHTNAIERSLVTRDCIPGQATGSLIPAFLTLFRNRALLLLSLSYGALSYLQYMFFYWLERYFETVLALDKPQSRNASTIVMLSMAVGMAVGGLSGDLLSRRFGVLRGRRSVAMSGMLASALFAAMGAYNTDTVAVVSCFSLAFFALGSCESMFWTSVTDIGGRAGGLAAAFLNTFGNGVGALAPALTIALKDSLGWGVALGFAYFVCAIGGLLWLLFDPRGPSLVTQQPSAEMP